MTKDHVKDLLARALWTALQTGLAVVVAAQTEWVHVGVWKAAGIAAVAAALSAIKTGIVIKTEKA